MRLFVALDIPEAVRLALSQCAEKLSKAGSEGRWVRLEGAHVTLKFIGEVPTERAEAIRAALTDVRGFAPVAIRFAGLGFFPNAKRPRVLWAGIVGGAELAKLAAAVDACVARLGVAPEEREFRPHVTLARFGEPSGLAPLRAAVTQLGTPEFGGANARDFFLYQSVLRPKGAEYTRLANYTFAGETAS